MARVRFEGLAKTMDKGVEGPRRGVEVVAPYPFQELASVKTRPSFSEKNRTSMTSRSVSDWDPSEVSMPRMVSMSTSDPPIRTFGPVRAGVRDHSARRRMPPK